MTCLVERQLLHHLLIAGAADGPQMVQLGLHDQVVVVADLLLDLVDRIARESRNDAVHERIAEVAVPLYPVDELLPQPVVLGVLDDILVQRGAVVLDQLAADDAQTLRRIAVEVLEALVEQRGHLGGIGLGRAGRQVVALLVADTGLGGVRDGDLELGREEIALVLFILHVWVERIHHALHQTHVLGRPLVLDALQIDMVHVVLLVQQVDHAQHLALGIDDRLTDSHTGIHHPLFIGDIDLPVHEGAQKVAFAELEDLHGAVLLLDRRLIQFLHHFHLVFIGSITSARWACTSARASS